jgi:hypothetical protein
MPRISKARAAAIAGLLAVSVFACSESDEDALIAGLGAEDKAWISRALLHAGTLRKRDDEIEVAVTGHFEPRHIEILSKVAADLATAAGRPLLELGDPRLATQTPPEDWPDADNTGLIIVSPVPFSIQIMNYLTVIGVHLKNRFGPSYKMQATVNHLLRKPVPTCRDEVDLASDGQPFIMVIDNSGLFEETPEAEAVLARCALELYLGVIGWDVAKASPYPDGMAQAEINRRLGDYIAGKADPPLAPRARAALRVLYSDALESGDGAVKLDGVLGR